MRRLLREFSGYGAASLLALAVDISVLWVLVRVCAIHYLAAATVSYLVGAVVAYLLSVRIAFREHRLQNRHAEFLLFLAIGTVGLAINAAVMMVAVQVLGMNYLLGKGAAAGGTFLVNFLARRQFLFVARSSSGIAR